jgi:DNA-binding NtrC family response regulator
VKRIIIVDDELAKPANGKAFKRKYTVYGSQFEFCGSLQEAVHIRYWEFDLVLLDIRFEGLGDDHGIDLLREIRKNAPLVPVVMLSSRTDPDILIRCWDAGANGYIVKWTANERFYDDLLDKIRRHARYKPVQTIIGESPAIESLRTNVKTLAGYDISVLITGETGTGKELLARALHDQGKRRDKPFIALNSGAIPATLIESELFGHVKGAFTGATDRCGKVEEASGGTLFLDEIGDLPLEMQVKLLRLLDSGEFVRIGENVPRKTDLRIVAATNRDLSVAVKDKTFREDLFYRLSGFRVEAPALRNHLEDLPLLADHFLELFKNAHSEKIHITSFSSDCMQAMQSYDWPGNVRELRNTVERSAILTSGATIHADSLPPSIRNVDTNFASQSIQNNTPLALSSNDQPCDKDRLLAELQMALEVKQRVQTYKGSQWKAEFMRLMYPHCKAANAKGFDDLIRRLTHGPWGDPDWEKEESLKALVSQLKE